MSLRHRWEKHSGSLLLVVLLAACSGGGGGQSASSSAVPEVSAEVGPEIGGGATQIGGDSVPDLPEVRAVDEFASFTPVAGEGWGADAAEVALGYRPDPDGLSFPNDNPLEPFGVDDAIALFGRAAVCVESDGACTPTAPAQAWIDTVAAASELGVCEGMVVLSLDRFLAASSPPTAELPLDTELNDRLVRLFATQFLPDVQEVAITSRGKSLRDTLTTIQAGFAPGAQGHTLGIYSEQGGHSLVPYAIRNISDTQATVYVYDPNWPGADRFIEFDLERETWRYAYGSEDAATDPEPWFGTGDALDLVPLDAREAPFDEPFPGAGNGEGRTLLTVTTTSSDWSVKAGGTTVTAANAVPGKDSVVAVSRGAVGVAGTTVVIEVDGDVSVEAGSGSVDVTLQSDRGAVRAASSTPAARFDLQAGTALGIEQQAGAGSLIAYAPTGVVTVDGAEGAQVAISGGRRVVFEGADGESGSVDLPLRGRGDFEVDADGRVRSVSPAASPGPATSVPPSSSTTSSTQPPNPNQVDVIVNFANTAPGVVFLQVNALTTTTADFFVQITGPNWNTTDGPTRAYQQALQGLVPGATYTVKVNFVDNTQTIRYFTVPGGAPS